MDYEYLFIGFVRRPTIPRYRVANTSTTVLPGKHTCSKHIANSLLHENRGKLSLPTTLPRRLAGDVAAQQTPKQTTDREREGLRGARSGLQLQKVSRPPSLPLF